MKLYFSPGACSLSPHIVLREAGVAFEIEKVDLAKKLTSSGADYLAVNPKGYVPALALDDGSVLTEGPAIVQYVADLAPNSGLAPPAGTLERYRLIEWLNFISTELHKSFSPLFDPQASDEWKGIIRGRIGKKFDWVSGELEGRPFLMGDRFTVTDAYLFTILGWTRWVAIDLAQWPVLKAYADRIAARPAAVAAMKAEGLIKA
jgi:glutathione S-transferase